MEIVVVYYIEYNFVIEYFYYIFRKVKSNNISQVYNVFVLNNYTDYYYYYINYFMTNSTQQQQYDHIDFPNYFI